MAEICTVIFSVGVAHPLYNKPVTAIIDKRNCGYDGRQVEATTLEKVHYPADPHGYLIYSKNKFIGYETKPAYDERWTGYCKILK